MRQVVALLMLCGAVGLVAAGCGGSSAKPLTKAAYDTQMAAIGKSLSGSITSLSSAKTVKQATTALGKLQVDLRKAVDQIDSITPPKDVKDQHKQLSTAVGELGDEISPVLAKLKAGKLTVGAEFTSVTSLKGLQDIQKAAAAITKAGYKIGG